MDTLEDMLDLNPDTVCRLIELAREFHAQEAVVIPDDPGSPADDWPTQILAAHASDMTLQEFRSIVDDLEPDQQHQLVALMWLGREDFEPSAWTHAVARARQLWTPRTADYLVAHPMLAEHLADGLAVHGHACD